MYDSSPNRPFTPSERWIVVIFALVIFGLLIAEILTNYDPAKLSILLVVVFWIPLLALHEAGHALAAAVLGWYVGQVVIGMGRTLARFRLGSAVVDIRLFPIQGYVTCVPRNLVLPRLKSALIYFAGPG